MSGKSDSKMIKKIVKGLEQQGARIVRTKKGYQILAPNGDIIGMHLTESDHRAMSNTRGRVRRSGLEWPLD